MFSFFVGLIRCYRAFYIYICMYVCMYIYIYIYEFCCLLGGVGVVTNFRSLQKLSCSRFMFSGSAALFVCALQAFGLGVLCRL